MFFKPKPKYKIGAVYDGGWWSWDTSKINGYYRIYKLIFNLFYIPFGGATDLKSAKTRLAALNGSKICMMCKTVMVEDQFGTFCPNEECIFEDIQQR